MKKNKLIYLIMFSSLFSCTFNKQSKIDFIIEHYKKTENINIEIIDFRRAIHLGWNRFIYKGWIKGDPLIEFQGEYIPENNSFLPNSLSYINYNFEYTRKMKSFLKLNNFVVTGNIYILPQKGKEINYKPFNLKDLSKEYKKDCSISYHIYCFDYSSMENIEWQKFQPAIDYLKDYPESLFSLTISFYPNEIFNKEDLRANEFGFGYDYLGFETCFEGRNLDKRIDIFEVFDVPLDSLISQWNEKIKQ